jgi:O-antigen/teichoic acid export membrane protein
MKTSVLLTNRFARQFTAVLSGYVGSAIIRAVALVLLARLALPDDFGFFSSVAAAIVIAQAMTDLGLAKLILREHSARVDHALVSAALRTNSRLSALLALLLTIMLLGAGLTADSRFFYLLPLAVAAAAEKNADTFLSIALANQQASVNTTNIIVRRTLSLLVFVSATSLGLDPLFAFSAGEMLAALVSAVLARRYASSRVQPATSVPFRAGLPFWLNSMAVQARNFDVLMTSAVSGTTQAGFYASATRLTGPLQLVASAAATVLLPFATRSTARLRMVHASLVFLAVTSIAYISLALLVPYVVPLVLGDAYVPSILVIQIVLIGLPFASLTALLTSALQGWGLARMAAVVAIGFTIVCLAGVFSGASLNGAVGASIGLTIAYVLQAIAIVLLALRHTSTAPTTESDR